METVARCGNVALNLAFPLQLAFYLLYNPPRLHMVELELPDLCFLRVCDMCVIDCFVFA